MPVINRIAAYGDDMTNWRKHLHAHPELGFDCFETARFVIDRLREFGVTEIHEGIATTGLVAIIEGQGAGPTIGLRADMDALPIQEATGLPHASIHPGKMHACGHDGHTTMLLGAAKYLAETRNFKGRVALIFQPAEEQGGGAGVMCAEGIMERHGIDQVFAIHNTPGHNLGHIYTTPGPIMAAVDSFDIHITGQGGHGAYPHECRDPVIAAVAIAQALQTIVSRNHYALHDLVVSVTMIHAGTAENIIPETAYLGGTVRSFDADLRDRVEARMAEIVAGQAASFGVEARLDYKRSYPATVNAPDRAEFAAGVAAEIVGAANVDGHGLREMGAEDFSYMLAERPGAYLFLGQGAGAGLHHPEYEFNDAAAPIGASFFARLVERAQPLE